MTILTLSGWTLPGDALAQHLPGADHLDYSDYPTPEASFAALAAFRPEHVIGWSMGGQLAIRAILAGVLKPKKLTLIAAPYQFVSGKGFSGGMDPITYQQFRASYASDAPRTMRRFAALMGKGDRKSAQVASELELHPQAANTERWLPWLDILGAYSLAGIDLSTLPPTRIIHGAGDAIAPIAQGEALAQAIPGAALERWDDAGHAPHLHDRLRFIGSINTT
jgi:pimeloyl-[acyl-carrier protein] methyl ester esterase